MRKAAIRHGDPTTTGGFVIAFTSTIHDDKKKVALSGDEATCGTCKGSFKIVGTGKGMSERGRDVVVDGDLVLCPCGKNRVIVGGNPGIFLATTRDSAGAKSAAEAVVPPDSPTSPGYDQHFQLIDQDGVPLQGVLVHLQTPAGDVREITTTPEGRTPIVAGNSGESIKLHINYRSE
ncbi:PAAR domain-containing protein [Caballeronia choica]|jgi:uncharacterized Zn-binding protein involved in type VI secretion|uniref:PAAR domain-containing protein n=1 Tax=Caballeronia choica TaxID=326476 RepID=UPI000A40CC17|nr:PAAR domain-containing protein [Caballeronia choica]